MPTPQPGAARHCLTAISALAQRAAPDAPVGVALALGDPPGRGAHGCQSSTPSLHRHRHPGSSCAGGIGQAGGLPQRCRCGRTCRGALGRRARRARHGDGADLRHRHRLGAVHRRPAGAQYRTGAHGSGRRGRRAARLCPRAHGRGPRLAAMGRAGQSLPRCHQPPVLAGADRDRWRRQQRISAQFGPLLRSRAPLRAAHAWAPPPEWWEPPWPWPARNP